MATTERQPPFLTTRAHPKALKPAVVGRHRVSKPGLSGLLSDTSRRLWGGSTHRWLVRLFAAIQSLGINLTPNHYYWPIPDLHKLQLRPWPASAEPAGIDLNVDGQAEFLQTMLARYVTECSFWHTPGPAPHSYHYNNGMFESVDAEVAYSMVRHFKPRRVVEIGGGFSTRILAAALLQNRRQGGPMAELSSIEPFPDETLRNGFPGLSTLIADPVQHVSLDVFGSLGESDILFIDSSHVVSIGSDVCYEILQILPALRKGVVVQFHDIFLPSDYPRRAVLENLCFWTEQYLLQAFLALNDNFEVLWSSSAMQFAHPELLHRIFPTWKMSYTRLPRVEQQFVPTLDRQQVWPSSFWIRRRA